MIHSEIKLLLFFNSPALKSKTTKTKQNTQMGIKLESKTLDSYRGGYVNISHHKSLTPQNAQFHLHYLAFKA